MSIESYMKAKSTKMQSSCTFRSKKNPAEVKKPDGLKAVHGRRLPVTVSQQSTYAILLDQAVQKWSAYDKNFDKSKEYALLIMMTDVPSLCLVSFFLPVI